MGTLAASLIATLIGVAISTTTGVVIDKTTDKHLNEPAHLNNVQAANTAVNAVTDLGTKFLAENLVNAGNVSKAAVKQGFNVLSALI